MNALRARNREKRVSERAQKAAQEANLSTAQSRAQVAKAAFLSRVQASRLAAQLPSLTEDVWLNARAEVSACDKMIAALQERRKVAQAQLEKLREPQNVNYRFAEVQLDKPVEVPKVATRIGVAVLVGDQEGEAMVYFADPVGRGEYPERRTYYPIVGNNR